MAIRKRIFKTLIKKLIGMFALIFIISCRPVEINDMVFNVKKQHYKEAYILAQDAIEKYPKSAEAWFYWGWLNGEYKENYKIMNQALNKAVQLNPTKKVAFQDGRLKVNDAVHRYRADKFLEKYSNVVKIILRAQESEDKVKRNELLEKASEKLTLLIYIDTARVEPYWPLAAVYFGLGDTTKALTVLGNALNQFPQNENVLIVGGEIYGLTHQYDKAEDLYKQAIEVAPSNSIPYLKLGNLESNRRNWEKAKEYYQKAVKRDPDNADLNYNVGVSLYNLQRYEEAIRFFVRSIETEPDSQLSYTILAGCYVRSETRTDEGIAFLENAVQRYPEDEGLWEFLAVLYGKKGMKDKAEEAFKKSQELKGN